MAVIKFRLDPSPTFKAKVGIPVPGAQPSPVEFTFKHRTLDAMVKFVQDEAPKMENAELVLACASGWELAEPFDSEHVEKLNQNWPGSARAIYETYIAEMGRARLGN